MSSDAIHAIPGVADRVRNLGRRAAQLGALRDRLHVDLERKQTEIQDLTVQVEQLSKVGELFRLLMDLLVDKQVRVVENVVSEGLKSIFHDAGLVFEAEVGAKYNRIAVDFYMRYKRKDGGGHRGRPLDAFGGGPSSVASLILRVLTILRLKLFPFLALDEALVAVSDAYVSPTGRFLQALAAKMGVDVLLVTHNSAFLEHADLAYRGEEAVQDDETRHLSVRRLNT